MAKTREIKKRMKAVANIRRITKTMQMIATSKFARAQQRAVATKPYTEGVFELVREIASTGANLSHPLIDGAQNAKPEELTLVITSDRGLCGPYNGSILRMVMGHFRSSRAANEGPIELVGKKGAAFLKFNGVKVDRHHSHFGDKPTFEEVARLADEYMRRFMDGEISRVRVAYMKFISVGKQQPTLMQLLPLKSDAPEAGAEKGPAVEYEFSPAQDKLLGSLLPQAVKATLYQAFNDAIVSEHVARMVAMKAATDNAGSMGKLLSRQYNRARQAQITTELTEIISGAAALE